LKQTLSFTPSCIAVYSLIEQGRLAYSECVEAFTESGLFRGFAVRKVVNLPEWMASQPFKPWWLETHHALVFGLSEWPERWELGEGVKVYSSGWPPIVVGNQIRDFGLSAIVPSRANPPNNLVQLRYLKVAV
jgi:hypothetical protein